jgi:hypothetical protein
LFVDLVSAELPAKTLAVAVDPGKISNRVLRAGTGLIGEPVSLSVQREGIDELCRLIESTGASETVVAIEATGSLHAPWAAEPERRLPGSLASLRRLNPGCPRPAGLAALQGRTTATAPLSCRSRARAARVRPGWGSSRRCLTPFATVGG